MWDLSGTPSKDGGSGGRGRSSPTAVNLPAGSRCLCACSPVLGFSGYSAIGRSVIWPPAPTLKQLNLLEGLAQPSPPLPADAFRLPKAAGFKSTEALSRPLHLPEGIRDTGVGLGGLDTIIRTETAPWR